MHQIRREKRTIILEVIVRGRRNIEWSEANRDGADTESPFPLFFSFSASFKNSSPREKVGKLSSFWDWWAESLFVSIIVAKYIIFPRANNGRSREKKNFWRSDLLTPSTCTIGNFEHAYVYWIWLHGSASYVVMADRSPNSRSHGLALLAISVWSKLSQSIPTNLIFWRSWLGWWMAQEIRLGKIPRLFSSENFRLMRGRSFSKEFDVRVKTISSDNYATPNVFTMGALVLT